MTKKNKLILVGVIAVLACSLILGCVFAFGTEAPAEKINLIVSTTNNAVAQNGEFTVTVKITNNDISSFRVAGLQVELDYDSEKLTAGEITHTLDTSESEAVSYAANGKATFVCIKKDFTDTEGYKTLNDLFTIKFKANEAIADPSVLFTSENISFLVGDTTALEVTLSDSNYAGSIPNLAEAILEKGLDIVTNAKAGTVIIIPTPANSNGMTKTDLENTLANDEIKVENDKDGVVGTGSKITLDGEEATVVVKGDVDGDGIITVFDAALIKEAQNNENAGENFTNKGVNEFAGDVDGDNNTNDNDAQNILDHVVGNSNIG